MADNQFVTSDTKDGTIWSCPSNGSQTSDTLEYGINYQGFFSTTASSPRNDPAYGGLGGDESEPADGDGLGGPVGLYQITSASQFIMIGDINTTDAASTGPFDRIRPLLNWMSSEFAPHGQGYNLGFADGHVDNFDGDELVSSEEKFEKLWTRDNIPLP